MRERFPNSIFRHFFNLAIYGQIVYLQIEEPIGQHHFVGKVEGQLLNVWQLGKMLRHFIHAQLDAREKTFTAVHLLESLHNAVAAFHLPHHPAHLGCEGMRQGVHFSADKTSHEL